jgi:hypothetical protein
VQTGETDWGLINSEGKRKPAWYALRNVASVIDSTYALIDDNEHVNIPEQDPDLIKALFKKKTAEGTEYLLPYWCAVSMRDNNTGVPMDVILTGINPKQIEAIDLLTGTSQPVLSEKAENGRIVLPKLIARDYPIVLRIRTSDAP